MIADVLDVHRTYVHQIVRAARASARPWTVSQRPSSSRNPRLASSSGADGASVHEFAGAAAAVALVSTGGLAASGALPGSAQDVASTVLDKMGTSTPTGDTQPATSTPSTTVGSPAASTPAQPAVNGTGAPAPATTAPTGPRGNDAEGKGRAVEHRQLRHSASAEGPTRPDQPAQPEALSTGSEPPAVAQL